jgi:bifunctional aspartokinase I/homeserine dehydrogenase I
MPAEKKIGHEPWHISYMPLAEKAKQLFSAEVLLKAWEKEEIAGKSVLTANLPVIFEQFFI